MSEFPVLKIVGDPEGDPVMNNTKIYLDGREIKEGLVGLTVRMRVGAANKVQLTFLANVEIENLPVEVVTKTKEQ